MGQGPSRSAPEQPVSGRRHRRSALLRPSSRTSEREDDGEFSRLRSSTSLLRRSSTLIRPRLNLPSRLPSVFSRNRTDNNNNASSPSLPNLPPTPSAASRPPSGQAASDSQRTIVPPFRRRTLRQENFAFDQPEEVLPDAQASARRASIRDLGSRIRQSLPQPALRRRSSSMQRGDDHTAMLSRLLSAAAVHTAASIIGEDPARPWALRGDENGAFDNFLESLQNGSLHTALRQSVVGDEGRPGSPSGRPNQLNFFRMFRLGTVENPTSRNSESEGGPARQTAERGNSGTQVQDQGGSSSNSDTRLVPIIIVGIRSINSGNPEDNGFPPFIDALSNLPAAATTPNDTAFDGLLSPARNNTSFSHRRRASMGGLANLQSAYDNQRAQHSDRARPFSATSESLTGARPPPSTPASAGLSAYPSGTTTPTQIPNNATGGTASTMSSRHGSFVRNTPGPRFDSAAALGSNSEESEALRRTGARRRRRSESDFGRYGSGSSRRNGVVGFDPAEDLQEEAQRSWIIYVLGGSYPENHPILSTPSLFSDSPTYEDMLLLSSLIGPAKPPVASETDIARAPGLFRVSQTTNGEGRRRGMVATEIQGDGVLTIAVTDRCLVCLSEFEEDEMIRQLVKCRHLFHRDCIDQWLTTGRNSCPLCREEGVEKSSETPTPTEDEPMDLST